ncbi:homocysteine biosynthesis protein [Pelotomaculum isophthalicicum JI]|uniref:Homocysteine biosynthesis protein n=1 Tax=Pelotomaculum isophthalicicum JI TaxID=947010 RepID=A0A9X4H639_9FIRM|nr:homocysteine biosynthesis protein [Pelotomaculum isophthalicicum]MDF9408603.1 homocysteine biosynthesis protein [Pelotomaculum isophthalicicum JI]
MAIEKTYAEINEKIRSGKAVVLTAEEVISLVEEKGVSEAARQVDVVTTGTFSPMCSSGVFLNFGHSKPRIRMTKAWLNGIPAYTGIAAVDVYLGATELPEDDPCNSNYPGEFRYGGGHVIQDLLEGKSIKLEALSYGTDCYPRRELETYITLDEINEATLFNPRNAYQNYNCAVNLSGKTIYTYMGMLKPNLGNAHYCSAGQLSPLLNDPYFLTIGIGTRIFLGGGIGYVAWHGTQHFPGIQTDAEKNSYGPAGGTLAVIGDLKQMKPEWLVGTSYLGYGATLTVGIGIPIPILNEDVMSCVSITDRDLYAPVVDYSEAYSQRIPGNLGYVSYAELKTGKITINGKEIPTAPLSSYPKAREIAGELKNWILRGDFLLSEPARLLPSYQDQITAKTLDIKGV